MVCPEHAEAGSASIMPNPVSETNAARIIAFVLEAFFLSFISTELSAKAEVVIVLKVDCGIFPCTPSLSSDYLKMIPKLPINRSPITT